jgi:hypothetical protein
MNKAKNAPYLLLACGVLTATGFASSSATPAAEDLSLDPGSLVPVLERAQANSDALPSDSSIGDQALIISETVRQLESTVTGEQWVALSEEGDICLIVQLSDSADGHPEDAKVAGASCTSPANFARYGASLRVEGAPGNGIVSHLLPSDIAPDSLSSSVRAETEVAPLVSMSATEADALGVLTIQRPNGGEIELNPMSMNQ